LFRIRSIRGARRVLLAVTLAGVLIAPTVTRAETPLTVSCASCLQDVVRELAALFETQHQGVRIYVNTGASQLLARQIEEGAPVDLFLSADRVTIDRLVDNSSVDAASIRVIARNRVVAITPADRVPTVEQVDDLASPEIRSIALPDSTAPIGRYTVAFLRAVGLFERLTERTVRTENARASLAAVISGAVDLAFVYATDAATTDRVRVVWTVPPETIPPVLAYGGLVRRPEIRPMSKLLLDFFQTQESEAAFRAAGFLPVRDVDR
jgi:molybdate transport system substrate-binding protein